MIQMKKVGKLAYNTDLEVFEDIEEVNVRKSSIKKESPNKLRETSKNFSVREEKIGDDDDDDDKDDELYIPEVSPVKREESNPHDFMKPYLKC
jgi:hypothetical protein